MKNLLIGLTALCATLTLATTDANARDVVFAESAADAGRLVIPLASADEIGVRAPFLDTATRDFLANALGQVEFDFAARSTSRFAAIGGYREILIVGLGSEPLSDLGAQDVGGLAAQKTDSAQAASLAVGGFSDAVVVQMALGARLGGYRYDRFQRDANSPPHQPLTIVGASEAAMAQFDTRASHLADAVRMTRDLINEPANLLYPESFVARVGAQFRGVDGVSMRIIEPEEMARLGMGSILSVGKGSSRGPRVMIVEYRGPNSPDRPILLPGKGITFDTGGISIKGNDGMWAMKGDMAGAAAVMGAALSLARSKAPVHIVAIAALAENMPSATASRPGDIVTAYNGVDIEIISTDAEGRLVLADALSWGEATYDPVAIVDVATLTGSVGRALGDEYGGLLTEDDAMAERLLAAGRDSGEVLWRLPMHPSYKALVKSPIADVRNSGTGGPGASTGAHFLSNFVADTPWAHLDIAGVNNISSSRPTVPTGMQGFGVRLLDRFVRDSTAASD